MSTQERIHRDVVIANRTYPLKIDKNDEEKILSIVKSVNHKIEQLKATYDAKDNQDYLAMCILQLYTHQAATSQHTSPAASPELNLEPQIEKIERLLESIDFG
jgi:cell division protein ZapA (FtsZ GTPase activity inhibitor)